MLHDLPRPPIDLPRALQLPPTSFPQVRDAAVLLADVRERLGVTRQKITKRLLSGAEVGAPSTPFHALPHPSTPFHALPCPSTASHALPCASMTF